jgi:SAM-dependent methyltransferase
VVTDHGDTLSARPANAHLIAETAGLPPGHALDAGCGHGAEALWLAAHGWTVTAVDFSRTALAHSRATAEALGGDIAGRIEWVHADLSLWAPQNGCHDLVACLYVHAADGVAALVGRLAAGVAPGGTLLLVGHGPRDPATGAPTAAADQVQVSVDTALAALDPTRWDIRVAEDRPRPAAGTGADAVIRARRKP